MRGEFALGEDDEVRGVLMRQHARALYDSSQADCSILAC